MEPVRLHTISRAAGSTVVFVLFIAWLSSVVAADAFAEEPESVTSLSPVVVTGTVRDDSVGEKTIHRERLRALPSGDGNVEDVIKHLPGIQLSDEADSSLQGGEIVPPLISISGGRPYQNNFRIDGLGNNSLLDPAQNNPNLIDRPLGHPQEVFLNARLIDEVTVYDHNVPVRFGGFTGGVVAVRTIDPASIFSGGVHYRTTRDSWAEFHVDPADRQRFEESGTHLLQPRFTKHAGGFDLSVPVSPSTGVLFAYEFVYSEIPLVFLTTTNNQHRLNQNYLLKIVHEPSATGKVTLEALYNPYEGEYFTKDTMNGDFTQEGGGMALIAGYEKESAIGAFDLKAGARSSENSRQAPKDFFNWTNSPSVDWGAAIGSGNSREGGFGDIEISQDSFEATADWASPDLLTGRVSHRLNAGLQWLQTRGRYDRDETSYSYRTSVPSNPPDPATVCGGDTIACIPGEQFLSRRSVYGESHATAEMNQYAVYLDDIIDFGSLELRPGLRYSRNDLMDNDDVAPRLSGLYDLFGDGRTRLIGGWSRYYGETLLTYKLSEKIALVENQERTTVIDNDAEWVTTSAILASDQFSELKTPYTDEIVAGFDQLLWGGTVEFRYVRRDGADEIARERDPFASGVVRQARLNNNGRSHYESYRLFWERQWLRQYLGVNVTYSRSYATHDDYDDTLLDEDLDERIYYDGELLYPDELPRGDFNRPWVASLTYAVKLPYGLRFTNITSFREGYRGIENSGNDIDVGGTFYDEYVDFSRPSATLFDWKIDWTPTGAPGGNLTLTLEILNVFDRKAHLGPAVDEFELGRQFWLGAEYRF